MNTFIPKDLNECSWLFENQKSPLCTLIFTGIVNVTSTSYDREKTLFASSYIVVIRLTNKYLLSMYYDRTRDHYRH